MTGRLSRLWKKVLVGVRVFKVEWDADIQRK